MVLNLNIDFVRGEVTPDKLALLQAVFDAHDTAARNNQNASSAAAMNAFIGSGMLANAIASAVMTLGHRHGPITQARFVYEQMDEASLKSAVENRVRVAGFGNSFFKDGIDPAWRSVSEIIERQFPEAHARLNELRQWLSDSGKNLFPNASMYSAIACSELGMIYGSEPSIFVIARTAAWTSRCIAL
jgi:citrate synthase